jgi:ABC-type bacteriocin/lantibiotic exporter with double-glycine peptidase domain
MDEATSALDDETEKAIMKKIYEVGADKTMIMIAHRLSTIEGCDRVYRVERGMLSNEQ